VRARQIAKLLEATDIKRGLVRFDKLSRMFAAETAMIVRLATKMRLTPHSSTDAKTVKHNPAAGRPKPWEIAGRKPGSSANDD
jgi:hypothetical protein